MALRLAIAFDTSPGAGSHAAAVRPLSRAKESCPTTRKKAESRLIGLIVRPRIRRVLPATSGGRFAASYRRRDQQQREKDFIESGCHNASQGTQTGSSRDHPDHRRPEVVAKRYRRRARQQVSALYGITGTILK